MRVNVYIHTSNEDKWKKIENKSAWLNAMLADGEQVKHLKKQLAKVETKAINQLITSTPELVRASQAECKGTHYMSRVNCGKPKCPWASV